MEDFSGLGLSEQILKNLEAKNYTKPTDVQAGAIPTILENKDLVIQSQTGSGKTASFAIPLLQRVKVDVPAVQFLVMVPTRELASQVRDEFDSLAQDTSVKICAIYGGADMRKQVKALKDGAQVIIGTPGRILDHLKRRTMSFSVVRGVVLDEADKMLSMGFLPDVQLIFRHLPKRRQMVMSSATFPYTVEQLIIQYMVEPEKLLLSSDDMAPKEIDHQFCIMPNDQKEKVLLALIEKESPEMSFIFCNTRSDVKSVHGFLTKAGAKAEALSSDLNQRQRERVLRKLRIGQVQHLVCTDLAARGIDIPALSHVFIFSSSGDPETYVHRTGRTGRAGRSGKAISLVSSLDLAALRIALSTNSIEATEIEPPTEEEIVSARVANHFAHLEMIGFAAGVDEREEFIQLAGKLTDEQGKALLPLLLEHFFRPAVIDEVEQPAMLEANEENTEPRGSGDRDRGGRGRERGGRDRGGRGRDRDRDRDRGRGRDREERGDVAASATNAEAPREETRSESPRREREDRGGRGRDRERDSRGRGGRGSFTTVCVALGRSDGLDEMDLQSILRRQGKVRMDDIGEMVMKEHESFVDIGDSSLSRVLAADGKHFKQYELYITKSPKSVSEARGS